MTSLKIDTDEQTILPANVGVIVVEDEAATRKGLANAVTAAGFRLVRSVADYASAAAALRHEQFDVVLLDLDLFGVDATPLISLSKHQQDHAKVIVISALGDETHALQALQSGADGFLIKSQEEADIDHAIRSALADDPPLSPAIARFALRALRDGGGEASQQILSPREHQMLQAIALGYSHREIADQYNLSYHTVIDYVRSMYRKLDVTNRSEALMTAVGRGIINPRES